MSTGQDIKEALADIGPTITIIRDSGDIAGEYVDYDTNAQVTKPFIREFFLEAMVSYDTDLIPGDVFEIDIIGERYLLMNKTPTIIEGEVGYYDSVFYKCNVSGELLRPSGETRSSQTYQKAATFSSERSVAYGLLTEPLFSGDLETEEQLGLIGIHKEELYIPSSFGIQVLDRYQPTSGEYYVVESIKPRRFAGVDVAILGEDNR